ncbi:Transcription termination factor 2, partial [Frankliniella fusca]
MTAGSTEYTCKAVQVGVVFESYERSTMSSDSDDEIISDSSRDEKEESSEFVIPPTDPEDSEYDNSGQDNSHLENLIQDGSEQENAGTISDGGDSDVIEGSPASTFKPTVPSKSLWKSLTKKNLTNHLNEVTDSSSLYVSFSDSGTPLKTDSIHHSSPKTRITNFDQGLVNVSSEKNSSANFYESGNSSAEVSDIEHESDQVNNNSGVDGSSITSGRIDTAFQNESANYDLGETPAPGSIHHLSPETRMNNFDQGLVNLSSEKNSFANFSKNGNSSAEASDIEHESDQVNTNSGVDGSSIISERIDSAFQSPRRSSLVDLTQSDSSLQNSPVGATRQHFSSERDIADIVAELSAVNNDLMVKEALLDSLNIQTLPDNGRNLMLKVAELQKRKSQLEKELHSNKQYVSQQNELNQMYIKVNGSVTKQSTLNFGGIKSEPSGTVRHLNYETENVKSETNQDFEDDFSPEERTLAFQAPNWGDLPKPDMTISGFGKRAMQTHLAEKALTLEALSSLHQALKSCPSEETMAEDPKYLKVELMPHQKHGLAWMMWREQERPSGGILADDMGLGKTISMISLILKSMESKEESGDNSSDSDSDSSPVWLSKKHSRMPKGGTLVVCPASLMNQWEREIVKRVKRHTLSVELYHGPKRETKPRRLAKYDVIITTYNLVSRESGVETAKNATVRKEQGPLFLIKWDRIILDEAHMVRNHKSQMALGVCELVGKHRWCLTGTPIQNKELDLYALLKFLRCSPFDDLTVWKRWVDNKNAAGMQRLNTMMKSLMLRRTKEQLQAKGDLDCLPDKFYEKVDIHLDPDELKIYEKVAIFSSTLFAQFLSQRAEKQQALDVRYGISSKPVWEQSDAPDNQFVTTEELAKMHRKMKGIQDIKTHQILVLLLRLRQICNHPGLVKQMVEDGDLDIGNFGGVEDNNGLDVDLFNLMNNLNIDDDTGNDEESGLNKSDAFTADNPVLDFERPSAKIRAVLDVIQEKIADTDDKAIVVSQWTSMLNVIAPFLKQMKIKFESLTGKVPVDKRQDIVNEFNRKNAGPQILLLSLTAGGVGLNLVGANHLLLVDIHWNPQLENQACDRIYRVGQKKDVFIYRFITTDTIEERIKALQDKKLAIAESVLTGTKNTQASKLTLDDLKMLFSVPAPAPSQPLLDDNNVPK